MAIKRHHKKSRLGCRQCKVRRIKCDEQTPCCARCARKGIECDYQDWRPATEHMMLLTPADFHARSNPSFEPPLRVPCTGSPTCIYSLDDFYLVHHFTLFTSSTLYAVNAEDAHYAWQYHAPRLAPSCEPLMHALLAFAAAHRSVCANDRGGGDMQTSRRHYQRGLKLAREADRLNPTQAWVDSAPYFYNLIGVLTLFFEFKNNSNASDALGSFIALVDLMQDLPKVETPAPSPTDGLPLIPHAQAMAIVPPNISVDVLPEVDSSLSLIDTIATLPSSARFPAAAQMRTFSEVYATLRQVLVQTSPWPTSCSHLLEWSMRLPTSYAELLRQRDSAALCLLAHWCVPLYNAPTKWFVGDWPGRLMLDIGRQLKGSEWESCMQWPLKATLQAGCGIHA